MHKKNKKRLIKIEKKRHSTVYFDKSRYAPNREEVLRLLQKANFANRISGWDLDRFGHGEIKVYFNPLVTSKSGRKEVGNKIISLISEYNRGPY